MGSAGLLTYFGAILGLTIESTSPEAYCPPVSEVKAAVAARVGDVTGEAFEARYGLVRDTQAGRTFVSLVLVDSNEREVLRREIPVSDEGCSDAALAIAVILERYFSGVVGAPSESHSSFEESDTLDAPTPGSEPVRREDSEVSEPPPEEAPEALVEAEPSPISPPPRYFVRGGVGMGSGPTPALHLAFGHTLSEWGAVFAELSSWPVKRAVPSQPYDVKSWFWELGLGAELETSFSHRLEAAVAPHFGLALQGAEVSGPGVSSEGARTRLAPTVGTSLRLGYRWSESFGAGVQVHGMALIGGERFVVQEGDVRRELLELPSGRGDASIYLSYAF